MTDLPNLVPGALVLRLMLVAALAVALSLMTLNRESRPSAMCARFRGLRVGPGWK